MTELKTLLKEARKLVDEKNFEEAQECCKNILRKDKQNYIALVLLGKSLHDSDQAPLAFQKAIACKSDNPLAWQGLANYYERREDTELKAKLFNIYEQILKLQIDTEKAQEILTKLGQLGSSLKSNQSITIILKYYNNSSESLVKEVAGEQLLELLTHNVMCKEDDISAVLKVLDELHPKHPNKIELIYAKVVLLKNNFSSAVEEIIGLNFFTTNTTLQEWLCGQLCMSYVKNNSFSGFDIESHFETINKGIEDTKVAKLLKSMICYERSEYLEAYNQCIPLVNYDKPDMTEALFLLRCTVTLKNWSITQKLATIFLSRTNDLIITQKLKKILFLSLAKQHDWKKAISAIQDVPKEYLSTDDKAMLAECLLHSNLPAEHFLDELRPTDYHVSLQALQYLKHEKYDDVVSLVEGQIQEPKCLFYLGKAYWELKQYDKCQINLLKAAKLNPEHPETFLYLGHFYRYIIKDLEKSKKCYEKANNLKKNDSEIVKNLSEVYSNLGLKEADFELLSNMNSTEDWVNFRLGLHNINKRDWENAVNSFRNVIKKNPNNSTAFECLADAYFSRGSYTSALRAYKKVILMDPKKALHCQARIGYIHTMLTEYNDAITTFREVLETDPQSILALKGIAETWMKIAKKKVSVNLYGSARDCAQQAVTSITKALTGHKEYLCLWKIYADTLMFITTLPTKYAFAYLSPSLKDGEWIRKEILDIFPQAIACYSHIAKQNEQLATYDLASAYFAYYLASGKKINCKVAFTLIIAFIKRKPNSWRSWNLLGKIYLNTKKYNKAQHCFIKALDATRKWSVAKIWCNLGTLYLQLKHYKLANYCYWRGQSTLPSYPQSWIGQGLIAEAIREEEAMDLFRHASRLGYHPESALGYADWVCRTLRSSNNDDPEIKYVIDALYAIPYATDLVEWFNCFESENALAHTIIGILQEKYGLLQSAYKSYTRALATVEKDKKNIALLNMGRILLRLQKYDEAIKTYEAITEASLDSASGLALALFKKGLYEESYAAYDTALHWLSNNDIEKADVLVAMAGILYMFKGPDDAKTLLFHSIQVAQKKPTAFSLFAICSLGLLHSDQSLSKLALSELQKYEKDCNFSFDIGFLKSYMLACEDSLENAIKSLTETVHDHPNNAMLWFCMAQYCLKTSSSRARAASTCAQRALCCARLSTCPSEPAKMLATASVAEHLAGDKTKALILAKKGLHMYPHNSEIWAALIFSLLANNTYRKDWLISAAGHMRRHLEITRPLSRWVGFLEKKLMSVGVA